MSSYTLSQPNHLNIICNTWSTMKDASENTTVTVKSCDTDLETVEC